MKAKRMNNLKKAMLLMLSILISASFTFSNGQEAANENNISYNLDRGSVDINYISLQDPNKSDMLTLDNVQPAHFVFTKNMNVNGTHINDGEYEVSLIEFKDGLGFNFHSLDDKKRVDTQVALNRQKGKYSEWLNYSLRVVEDDKLAGEFNWKENKYTFSMEIALSNTIFSYLEKEEVDKTADWIDYYQAAIYAYKNDIDLTDSYVWAQKALKSDQNQHTINLNRMYVEALGQDTEAQQLSALQD